MNRSPALCSIFRSQVSCLVYWELPLQRRNFHPWILTMFCIYWACRWARCWLSAFCHWLTGMEIFYWALVCSSQSLWCRRSQESFCLAIESWRRSGWASRSWSLRWSWRQRFWRAPNNLLRHKNIIFRHHCLEIFYAAFHIFSVALTVPQHHEIKRCHDGWITGRKTVVVKINF